MRGKVDRVYPPPPLVLEVFHVSLSGYFFEQGGDIFIRKIWDARAYLILDKTRAAIELAVRIEPGQDHAKQDRRLRRQLGKSSGVGDVTVDHPSLGVW
jgi:hypothetical protein